MFAAHHTLGWRCAHMHHGNTTMERIPKSSAPGYCCCIVAYGATNARQQQAWRIRGDCLAAILLRQRSMVQLSLELHVHQAHLQKSKKSPHQLDGRRRPRFLGSNDFQTEGISGRPSNVIPVDANSMSFPRWPHGGRTVAARCTTG